ncbi:hypothetical protein V5799_022569 [Amblyomma americanum]|uniref:Uncharacterized protein n=1 Tax=Amblyomma americanum TaxID=6943 RepID=A0AAQ4FK52_AMBAM
MSQCDHLVHNSERQGVACASLPGDPGSLVYGSVVDGVFEGRISTGDGRVFYAEPSWKYSGRLSKPGHTVFYAGEDVRLPPQLEAHGGCGLDKLQAHLAAQGIELRARSVSTFLISISRFRSGTVR